MSNWKTWAISLPIGLVISGLEVLLALWIGTVYMNQALKLGGGQ